ncbi:hypothetical protein [Roseovarius salis]|uniref:hypothetical protein n=1 Tax=Roseovarius salis TaxID=3376063 RepID=UPI0037CA89FD
MTRPAPLLVLALSLAAGPGAALSIDMSSLTPTLTYPAPDTAPVNGSNADSRD